MTLPIEPPSHLLEEAVRTADMDPLATWYEEQLENGSPGYPFSTIASFVDQHRDKEVWESVSELFPTETTPRRGRPRKTA